MSRSYFGSVEYIDTDYYRVWWTDKSGKRRSKRLRNTTRDEAEAYLASMNLNGMPNDTTWSQFWQVKVVPQVLTLAQRTQEEYFSNWEKFLKPEIGDEPVSMMDWHRANEVITSAPTPHYQKKVGRLLKKICNMAIRDRGHLLLVNPVDRAIEYAPYRPQPKRMVDITKVNEFMAGAKGSKYEPLMLILLGFGMRVEEGCALLWEDIRPYEFKGNTYCVATVNKALTVSNSGKIFKETKNTYSEREAICGEPFASRLLELAEGKTGAICPSGRPYDPANPADMYTSPVTIVHNWKLWCERHNMEYIRPKEMRYSYSTMMGEAIVSDSIVRANMGHAPTTTREKHYQRVTMRAKCAAADMLADTIAELAC